jgi:hypothetical protein
MLRKRSPISSRKIVPRLADSNFPILRGRGPPNSAGSQAEQLSFEHVAGHRRAVDLGLDDEDQPRLPSDHRSHMGASLAEAACRSTRNCVIISPS